jgi:hypothetical protein
MVRSPRDRKSFCSVEEAFREKFNPEVPRTIGTSFGLLVLTDPLERTKADDVPITFSAQFFAAVKPRSPIFPL